MFTETRTITINDEGLEPWLVKLVRKQALLFPEIEKIVLYGSQATGKATRYSDVDLAYELENNADEKWEEILDTTANHWSLRTIDCTNIKYVNEKMRREIQQDGKVLYVRS